jgi:hypothetical protein
MELDSVKKEMKVSLFADTKSEVSNDVNFEGKLTGYQIAQGSDVMTASGEMAFRKSDGTWSWL